MSLGKPGSSGTSQTTFFPFGQVIIDFSKGPLHIRRDMAITYDLFSNKANLIGLIALKQVKFIKYSYFIRAKL